MRRSGVCSALPTSCWPLWVCWLWLHGWGNVGKNNKMFLLPMAFMLVVTITSLVITIKSQFGLIAAGGADWGAYVKAILGLLLVVLAIILTIEGIKTLAKQKSEKQAA